MSEQFEHQVITLEAIRGLKGRVILLDLECTGGVAIIGIAESVQMDLLNADSSPGKIEGELVIEFDDVDWGRMAEFFGVSGPSRRIPRLPEPQLHLSDFKRERDYPTLREGVRRKTITNLKKGR